MIKVGRYTAGLLLLAVGAMLIMDQAMGGQHFQYLIQWWPVLFILWGTEYIILNVVYRNSDRRMKLDLFGVFMAVLFSGIVFSVTQPSYFADLWKKINFNFEFTGQLSAEKGIRIEKPTKKIQLESTENHIIIENENGNIVVKSGSVQEIEVQTVMWVDHATQEEANKIAEQSVIEVTNATSITIQAKGKSYGSGLKTKPKMNMTVIIPENREVNAELNTTNGDVAVIGLNVLDNVKLSTKNGDLDVEDIQGDVQAETLLGDITLSGIQGNVQADTKSGEYNVTKVTGNAVVSTLNGDIRIEDVGGEIKANTKNGDVTVNEATKALNIETLNGSIYAQTSSVGGNWDIYSAIGDLNITLPEEGSYEVKGSNSFGSMDTDLPFSIHKNEISGTIGTGEYTIHLETNNDIQVKKN